MLICRNYSVYVIILSLCIVYSCTCISKNSPQQNLEIVTDDSLNAFITLFQSSLEKKKSEEIEKFFTDQGYKKFLKFSDCLNNIEFIGVLSSNLKKKEYSIEEINDSSYVISVGKKDEIVGAYGGYYFVLKTGNQHLIYNINLGK